MLLQLKLSTESAKFPIVLLTVRQHLSEKTEEKERIFILREVLKKKKIRRVVCQLNQKKIFRIRKETSLNQLRNFAFLPLQSEKMKCLLLIQDSFKYSYIALVSSFYIFT